MIKSFADKETRKVFEREHSKKLPEDIQRRATRKLMAIDFAEELRDLRTPPGNRLEKLGGDRAGQWSIRINQQWRICFDWKAGPRGSSPRGSSAAAGSDPTGSTAGNPAGDAHNVEIVDYH